MCMTTLKININILQDGEHNFDFILTPKKLDIDAVEIITDVSVEVNLYKAGNQFDLNIKLKGKFKLLCDRCIEDYIHDFANSFEVIYKYDFNKDEIANEDDDIKFISPKTNFIDLIKDVRDYIMLSIPMKHVPGEKDGICTYCNKDTSGILNIERQKEISPVWEKLIQTKSK